MIASKAAPSVKAVARINWVVYTLIILSASFSGPGGPFPSTTLAGDGVHVPRAPCPRRKFVTCLGTSQPATRLAAAAAIANWVSNRDPGGGGAWGTRFA